MQDFVNVAGEANPHPYFGAMLGRMLLHTGEIDQPAFDAVGEVQARTIIIAEEFERGDAVKRQMILDKFGGRERGTGEPTGKLDLNGALFSLKIESAVADLDSAIADFAVEELDTKMSAALDSMRSGKGVHPDAAAVGAITKALLLADYNRDAKQAIVDASLTMQHVTRGLERLQVFHTGDYDRNAALGLMNTSNKLNYKFDPPVLQDVNEALLSLCTTEMEIDSALQRGTPDIDMLRQMHELSIRNKIQRFLSAMPTAAQMYRDAGKEALAVKVEEVHSFYQGRYDGVMNAPHVMLSNDEYLRHAAHGAPAPGKGH